MNLVQLGQSDLQVTPVCLGTMTFGEQVDEADSHAILSRSLERGVNFIDTAEMYAVPPRAETFQATEKIVGNWLANNPGARDKLVLATKVAGPSRGMPWIRGGSPDLSGADIIAACEGSLKRLKTDVIDLYQLHWPTRNVPMFGGLYYDPAKDNPENTSIHAQLEALQILVKAGKVRAIGLSNETPYGVHEFVRLAEQHGLPRIAKYESMRKQRWGRAEALEAARRYNALALAYGLTPTQMALAFCYTKWQVKSTIIGVTSLAQLDEDLDAWGTTLPPELLNQIDAVRWELRDPAA